MIKSLIVFDYCLMMIFDYDVDNTFDSPDNDVINDK